MALTATLYRVQVGLSDVDRSVYKSLDLRLARHPSESTRYLVTRLLAYVLSYDEGIAWSKGGISSTDEPPISVRDATGVLRTWIDVGTPSADRLHKAAKAADRVLLYTADDLRLLRREVAARSVHRVSEIEVWRFDPNVVAAFESRLERQMAADLTRSDGRLYATIDGATIEGDIERLSLTSDEPR